MSLLRKSLLSALVVATFSCNAQAEIFNYSYTFGNGSVVSGSFDGTASGNLVTGLSNITAAIDNVAYNDSGSLFGSSLDFNTYSWVSGGAVASFDGTQNNFLFIDVDYPNNYSWSNYFYSNSFFGLTANNANTYQYGSEYGSYYGATPYLSRWTLTPAAPVPEPETYVMLLAGLGLLRFTARRRKQSA